MQMFDNMEMRVASPRRRIRKWILRKLRIGSHSSKDRRYLVMRRTRYLDFGLEFIGAVPFGEIQPGREGCQSLYRIRSRAGEVVPVALLQSGLMPPERDVAAAARVQ